MEKENKRVYMEYNDEDANSHKFYEINLMLKNMDYRNDAQIFVTWGRIGSEGQEQMKYEGTYNTAVDLFDKIVDQKEAKGYVMIGDDDRCGFVKVNLATSEGVVTSHEKSTDDKVKEYIEAKEKIKQLKALKKSLAKDIEEDFAEFKL